MVKNPPTKLQAQELKVQSLGHKDPRDKELTTHSGILAWKTPWTEKPDRLHGIIKELAMTEHICMHSLLTLDIKKRK